MPEVTKACNSPRSPTIVIPPKPGVGQRTGAVHDLMQDGIEVKVFTDAEDGLGQAGQPVPQRLDLLVALVGVLQLFTPIRLRSTLYPGLSGPGWMGRLDLGRAQPGSTHFTKIARNAR